MSNRYVIRAGNRIKSVGSRPETYMDEVALRHDREVPAANFVGCNGKPNEGACRNKMRAANDNFVKGFTNRLTTGEIFKQKWNQAISDLCIGIAGLILFSIDNLSMNLSKFGDQKRVGSREQYLGEQMNLFMESIDDALIMGLFIKRRSGDKRRDNVIVEEIIRNEINRMIANYISWEVNRACNSNRYCVGLTWLVVMDPTRFSF